MDRVIRTAALNGDAANGSPIQQLDLDVPRGQTVAVVDSTGVGSTGLIRLLLGLDRPSAGRCEMLREPSDASRVTSDPRLGCVTSDSPLPRRMAVHRHLDRAAKARGAGADRIGPLAQRLRLDLRARIGDLDAEALQKVRVITAFMHEPELLVLDEPFCGRSPRLSQVTSALLEEARANGATILIGVRDLDDVADVAERIVVIRDGRIVSDSDMAALRLRLGHQVDLRFGTPMSPAMLTAIGGLDGVTNLRRNDQDLSFTHVGHPNTLIKLLARGDIASWSLRGRSVEDLAVTHPSGDRTSDHRLTV